MKVRKYRACELDPRAEVIPLKDHEKAIKEVLNNQWISVEESMPKPFKMVLVMIEHNGEIHVYENFYNGSGVWKFGKSKIIAWMPIPPFDKILKDNKDVLERLKDE